MTLLDLQRLRCRDADEGVGRASRLSVTGCRHKSSLSVTLCHILK
jgi:hypothetical protein